jgi:DNA polymerase-3 subunit delta'
MPFRDVVGHVRLIDLLSRSVAGGTLPPSLLFAGPAGIGKRLTALAVAQALNCTNITTGSGLRAEGSVDACGKCPACSRIARGIHPDVLFIAPNENGNIRIEPVRDAIDRAQYRPFEGRRRVVIIDEADALMHSAQNALLKTLEEPTASSVFILISARPDMLLPTVLSRCPQLRFRQLSTDEIAAALIVRGRSETEARAVAATADGSLSHAVQANAEDLVAARKLALRVLENASTQKNAAQRVGNGQQLVPKAPAGVTDREQLSTHLQAMAALLRDAELLATGADESGLANTDVRPALTSLATAYRGERGTRAFAAVDRALVALKGNVNAKLVADWLVLQL